MSKDKGNQKLPKFPLTIGFVTPGMPFNADTATTASLGGSETMGMMMAHELAKRGHMVIQMCNTDKMEMKNGVQYVPIGLANDFVSHRPLDVVIGQRAGEIFASHEPTTSKLRFLWHHDLAIHRHRADVAQGAWNATEHMVLSEFHKSLFIFAHLITPYCIVTYKLIYLCLVCRF